MTAQLEPLLGWLAPLANPFAVLLVLVSLPWLRRRAQSAAGLAVSIAGLVLGFAVLYHLVGRMPRAGSWLSALNSPLCAVFLVVVLPAMYLPRNRGYRFFLLLPASLVLLLVLAVVEGTRTLPPDLRPAPLLLVRPAWLIAGGVSLLVLLQPFLPLAWFRRAVRLAAFLVLVYGGFALRQDVADYRAMLARRGTARDIMNISETVPVLSYDDRLAVLPAAPCRFAPDGGYVQGCNLELFQRLLQVNFLRVRAGDPSEVNALGVVLAALLTFLALSFVLARWSCGWLCPLSAMGSLLNWGRVRLGLAPLRPAPPVKWAYLFSGVGFSGIALAMAGVYPYIDAQGKFAGCKIPIYPFCKLCPSQQLCPVAGAGLSAYPPVPGTEWAFGFFRYGCLALLALFLISFASARRLWCRFCPMGMISGLFNRGGLFALRKQPQKCSRCGMCAETCPMDIGVVRDEMNRTDVSSYHCVLCLKCVEKCPRDGCLALEHAGLTVMTSRFKREDKP